IDQNLVVIYFYINGQEYNVELNEYTYLDTDKLLSVQIDIDSPGHFVLHDENIYQLTLFATVLNDEEFKKVYFIVYNRQLDHYHSVYYNTSRFTFEDYQMPE